MRNFIVIAIVRWVNTIPPLQCSFGLNILQTWDTYTFIHLNKEHKLKRKKQKLYETPYSNKVNLLKPLKLYAKPDKTSDSYILPAQKVTFIMTDNRNWCKLKANDLTEGWFYTDGCYMEDLKTLTTEVFDGLAFYD